LRTPLEAIIGFSEMGASMAAAVPDLHEMFDDIHAGGRRMLVLVNGLLDVDKLGSTVGSLRLLRSDLALIFSPESLFGNVDAFRFQHVPANALRFASPGSGVAVDARDLGPQGVEITVRDHGPGIPPDELEGIFEAFVQSSRTRDGSGRTGLGLTICRKIMGARGGSIEAANADGSGALMRIRLPAAGMACRLAALTARASASRAPRACPAPLR
jgi:signal transduction histidine kinase